MSFCEREMITLDTSNLKQKIYIWLEPNSLFEYGYQNCPNSSWQYFEDSLKNRRWDFHSFKKFFDLNNRHEIWNLEDLRRHKYLFVKGRQSHWTHKIWNKKYIYCFYETHFSNMVTKIAPIDFDDIRKTLLKIGGVIFILSKKFSSWILVMKYKIWRIWDVINTFCKNRFSRFHCRQERFWIDFRTSISR